MLFDAPTLDVVFVLLATVLAVGILVKPTLARFVVGTMLFVVCLSPAYDFDGFARETWLFPVQEHRSEVYLLLALSLLVGMGPRLRLRSLRSAGPQAAALFLIALYQGFLRMHHDGAAPGLATIAFAVFTVGVLMMSLPALVRRPPDWPRMLRAVLCASIAWIGAIMVQVAIDPAKLIIGNRFAAVTSNAQTAAIVLSISSVLSLWMAMHDPKRRYRVPWFCLACVNSILLVWTGSRTGALAALLGMVVVLRHRLARSIGWVAAVLLSGYGLYCLVAAYGLSDVAARLTSAHDSGRTEALATMLRAGLTNPMFGTGIYDVGASENSYLLAFAAFGLGMVLLVLLLLTISIRECARLTVAGRRVPQYRPVIDLIVGFNVMYFTIAMFEGIILARVRETVVFMLVFSALSAALRRQITRASGERKVARRPQRGTFGARRVGAIPCAARVVGTAMTASRARGTR